jgi:hypothetical protein
LQHSGLPTLCRVMMMMTMMLQVPGAPGQATPVPPLLPYQHHQLGILWREFPTQQQAFDYFDSLPPAMQAQTRWVLMQRAG